jgi:hypothetical protein
LATWLGTDRARWAALLGWIHADAAREVLEAGREETGWIRDRGVDEALALAAGGLGLASGDAWQVVRTITALIAAPEPTAPADAPGEDRSSGSGDGVGPLAAWFELDAVRTATGWHRWEAEAYVDRQGLESFLDAVAARDLTLLAAAGEDDAALDAVIERSTAWREAVADAGWRVTAATDPKDGPL